MSDQPLPAISRLHVPDRQGERDGFRRAGLALGLFSLALGAAEIFGSRRIAEALEVEDHEKVVKGFGYREVAAGAGILMQPAVATGVWNRVAGDVMDIAAAAFAVRRSPGNRLAWGALAFVTGALALDAVVARGLDRTTGKTSPTREPALA